MKALIVSIALALLAGNAVIAEQNEHSQAHSAKPAFLVIYKPGPAWLPGKPVSQQPLGEHGKYVLSLYNKGALKIGGPFTDDTGGAMVLHVADLAEAKDIVTKDPAVVSGVFIYELHPWGLVDWEARSSK